MLEKFVRIFYIILHLFATLLSIFWIFYGAFEGVKETMNYELNTLPMLSSRSFTVSDSFFRHAQQQLFLSLSTSILPFFPYLELLMQWQKPLSTKPTMCWVLICMVHVEVASWILCADYISLSVGVVFSHSFFDTVFTVRNFYRIFCLLGECQSAAERKKYRCRLQNFI